MRRSRRKILIRIVVGAALVLLLLDAALYLAVVRPVRRLVATEQQARGLAEAGVLEGRRRVERLKKFQQALPGAHEQIRIFLEDHIPSRRRGYSRAARLVRQLTEESGIQLSSVTYKLNSAREEPLQHLGIEVTVEGPFMGLLKFAHGLETAKDFILVRDFIFQPGEGGSLAMRLGADVYLEP